MIPRHTLVELNLKWDDGGEDNKFAKMSSTSPLKSNRLDDNRSLYLNGRRKSMSCDNLVQIDQAKYLLDEIESGSSRVGLIANGDFQSVLKFNHNDIKALDGKLIIIGFNYIFDNF